MLPTGAGKTFVAELCIADADRSALVVTPTLELVSQWAEVLHRAFGGPIGMLGGGIRELAPITVSTYDSAHLYAERFGNQFGLLVFDEVHHLPGPSYLLAASSSIAPFRLGLTATLHRPDGGHDLLTDLVGPVIYERTVRDLGDFLAPYRTEVVEVHLDDGERTAYEAAIETVRAFRQSRAIGSGMSGFQQFLREGGRSDEGRRALAAFRESRRILQRTPRKLELLARILAEHRGARCLVFTSDNATAYEVSRTFLVPAVTHRTPTRQERTGGPVERFRTVELPGGWRRAGS